jgi:ABC-type Fe3+-siderophore transport system permease subunit
MVVDMQRVKTKLLVLALTLLMVSTFAAGTVRGADGSNGNIEDNIGNAVDGERVYVHCYNLDVSSDYLLNHTGDDTGVSFTTGAAQTEIYVPITLDKSATSEVYVIYLRAQSAGTALDTVTIFVSDPEDLTQEDLFMDLAIPIMIMAIFAAIALGFVGKRRR